MSENKIIFKPFTKKDIPVFLSWSKKAHVKNIWFADSYESIEYYQKKAANNNGYDYPFIIYLGNEPIGYIQGSDLYAYRIKCPAPKGVFINEEPGTFCLDLFIGEENFLNQGYGTLIVKAFINKIFDEFHAKKILIDPASSNKRAIRCYEKAGFKFLREEFDGANECYIMQITNDGI